MAIDYSFPGQQVITDYWRENYATEHCTLCGNSGIIDTRLAVTAAGVPVGRLNWCICPNGQIHRHIAKGDSPRLVIR